MTISDLDVLNCHHFEFFLKIENDAVPVLVRSEQLETFMRSFCDAEISNIDFCVRMDQEVVARVYFDELSK